MKILTVIGARPQFVKAGALSREFRKYPEIDEIIVHTGQHFDKNMSAIFFEEMEIPLPHYNLNINGLNHGAMTGQMLEKTEAILLKEKPDYLLVYGDTNSTLAGALAAAKLHIKVIHIEAGLRSFNMKMPEEINRILTDRISSILFCPTETAVQNLKNEGFDSFNCIIYNSGDVMQDAALYYSQNNKSTIVKQLGIAETFYLCTIHRPENTDNEQKLRDIFQALNQISEKVKIILPIHPRTHKKLNELNLSLSTNIQMIEPVGYFDMLALLKNCKMVITDSGGLQKEACFFQKYCITMRAQTEWIELVENKACVITSSDSLKIIEAEKNFSSREFPQIVDLYGGGNACKNIVKGIIEH